MNGWDLYELVKEHYSFDVVAEIWVDLRKAARDARNRGEKMFVFHVKPNYTFRCEVR